MNKYDNEEVLKWHADYVDLAKTVRQVTQMHDVKHDTMLKHFRDLQLWLRPSGFRANNRRGTQCTDPVRYQYLWFFEHGYKRRAKRKGFEVTLTEDQFIALVTSDCFYCGKSWESETRKIRDKHIKMCTIDRMDSKMGYTPQNCVSCCKICNTIKMDIPYEEWIKHIHNIAKRHPIGSL